MIARISAKGRRAAAWLMAVLLLFVLVGCRQKAMPVIEISENREGEAVFSLSAGEFIERYNALARKDKNAHALAPLSGWTKDTYDTAIHSRHETICYTFTEEPEKWLLPTVSIYVPANADAIQEITLNFDDHGYTAEMYHWYEEYCFYAIKVFFPDLADDSIIEMYTKLNDLAYEHFTNEPYTAASLPCALYHKDGIGLYPYFANGECVHLCIIPVTPALLGEWEAKGVDIYEMISSIES